MAAQTEHQRKQSKLIKKNAKYLLAIIWVVCLGAARLQSAQSSLVQVYHKYRSETEPKAPIGFTPEASSQTQLLKPSQPDEENEANSRVSTIEFGSPMKRIMDLIGQHVIVLDEEQQKQAITSSQSTPSEQQVSSELGGVQTAAPILAATPIEQAATGQHYVSNQQQLLGQPQQQHWTVLQQPMSQQNQQQQQLLPPGAISNEHYFAFTPFALNQVGSSNLFAQQQQQQQYQPFLSYPEAMPQQQQQQQQQQTSSDFNQMTVQSPQSSQNHQQQQAQNEVQPVFLSSYVPELPSLTGASGSAFVGPRLGTNNYFSGQQQQPDSIQQIQQAQKLQQPTAAAVVQKKEPTQAAPESEDQTSDQEDSKSSSPDGGSGDDDSSQPSGGGGTGDNSKDDEGEQSIEEPKNMKRERAADGDGEGDGEPSSGSISYEDKYDSDKEEAVQKPVKAKKSRPREFSSAASAPVGLSSVGLNDDCLQCICRASSGCDHDVGCIPMGTEERYCGPFQLTQDYWERANRPRDAQNNFSSFDDCANDSDCAVETVTKYMMKYIKDCDGDEQVTCLDYALLHRLEPNKCNQTDLLHTDKLLESYWQKFQRCAEGYSKNRNGDDESI